MIHLVECPTCEVEFPISGPLDAEYDCPHCHQRFSVTHAVRPIRSDVSADASSQIAAAVPIPRRLAKARQRAEAGDSRPVADDMSPPSANIQTPLAKPSDSNHVAGSPVRANDSAGVWLIAGSLTLVIALALGIVFFRLNQSTLLVEKVDTPPHEPVVRPPLAPAPVPLSPQPTPAPSTEPAVVADAEADWTHLRSAEREEYFSLWSKIQPHLVRLQVRTPTESRTVAGVIVDSRGYVATSFCAIRDAISIEVRPAAKSLTAGEPWGELSDQVRGLVAKDEGADLALLEINRRFISSFASLTIDRSDRILPGDRCTVAAPPTAAHRLWISDFPIRQVLPFDRLGSNIQQEILKRGMQQDALATWFLGAIPGERFVPGSPLFNFSGELIGLVTSASADDSAVAAPSRRIAGLLGKVSRTATPFPIDPQIIAAMTAASQLAQQLPNVDSPAYALAHRLQQTLQSAAQFQFLPKSPQQYESFLAFAESALTFDESMQAPEWSKEDASQAETFFRNTLDRCASELQQGLQGIDVNELAKANQWANESAKAQAVVAIFGDVARTGIQQPDGLPFVIFRVLDGERYLFSPVRYDGPIFLPGSRWLLIGQASPKLSYRSSDGISVIEAEVAEIKFVFPLN